MNTTLDVYDEHSSCLNYLWENKRFDIVNIQETILFVG